MCSCRRLCLLLLSIAYCLLSIEYYSPLFLLSSVRPFFNSEFKIHKQSSEVLTVVFDAVIHGLNMWLLQKAFNFFSQLPASFSWYDLYFADLFIDSIIEGLLQGFINSSTIVVNIVKVKFDTSHKCKYEGRSMIYEVSTLVF